MPDAERVHTASGAIRRARPLTMRARVLWQDDEISGASPPGGSSKSPPSATRSPLTAANVQQLGGGGLRPQGGGGGGGVAGITDRKTRAEINMLQTEVAQLEEQKQNLVDQNRDLKLREDTASRDRDEMQRKLEAKEADLKRVREHIDAEIQHRKSTDTRLRESERKLADQEKAFAKVQENLKNRLNVAEAHLRRDQDAIHELRQRESALQKRIEEEQDETLAITKARNNAMATVKKHQVPLALSVLCAEGV